MAPETKVELQSLIGKINFIRRFIANLSGKIQSFSPLLKLKADQKFVWGEAQQKALDEIKHYLTSSPVLVPPQKHKPLSQRQAELAKAAVAVPAKMAAGHAPQASGLLNWAGRKLGLVS